MAEETVLTFAGTSAARRGTVKMITTGSREKAMADKTFSRRRFGMLAAGAGLAAAAAPLVTTGSASAAIDKYHGPLLTAGWEDFKTAVAQGRHNLTKVVATW